jgi:hypothetical protein
MRTFLQFLEEIEIDAASKKNISRAVARSISSMPGDQAMDAITGQNPQAQKRLIASTLKKPNVNTISDLAPVIGIKPPKGTYGKVQ